MRPACSILLLSLLLGPARATAQGSIAQPVLGILEINGRAEVRGQNDLWRPLATLSSNEARRQNPENGLRTGVGRVKLQTSAGQVLMGSHSQVRVYQNKPDLQSGQFFAQGPVAVYVLGRHVVMEKAGRFRVDLTESGQQRIAILQGEVRISGVDGLGTLKAGQQIQYPSARVLPFTETDPWYLSQFVGIGSAQIEGLSGTVGITRAGQSSSEAAKLRAVLNIGDRIRTAEQSWAELGFDGGGYLRLAEKSELSVLSIEKTTRGREVVMQLQKGSAWNVVQKGLGGYRISTPVISTAVRGTTFRIDAEGLVKVIEGEVALPSKTTDLTLSTGQQKQDQQPVAPLELDQLDRWNIALDAQRNQNMSLVLRPLPKYARELFVHGQVLPNTKLIAQLSKDQQPAQALSLPPMPNFEFRQELPEGRYQLSILAQRYDQTASWRQDFIIDRTSPILSSLQVSHKGRVLSVKGVASDNSLTEEGAWLHLVIEVDEQRNERWLSGWKSPTHPFEFMYLLPAATAPKRIALTLVDRAGNETYVRLR